jgi:hypothetical protein
VPPRPPRGNCRVRHSHRSERRRRRRHRIVFQQLFAQLETYGKAMDVSEATPEASELMVVR